MNLNRHYLYSIVKTIACFGIMQMVVSCHNDAPKQPTKGNPEPDPLTMHSDSVFAEAQKAMNPKSTYKNDTLSGFLLSGIYFTYGYGGIESLQNKVNKDITNPKDTAKVIAAYKKYFEFPFKQDDKNASKIELQHYDDIKSRAELIAKLDSLQSADGPYKAWNYTRLINFACIGYAADYLSKDEVYKYLNNTLPLAQKAYNNWGAYYKDFTGGRKNQYPKDKLNPVYDSLATEISKGNPPIYNILPLN